MPYTADNVPDYVTQDRARWAAIWNTVHERTGDERTAFQFANGVMLKRARAKALYSPPAVAASHELRSLWTKVFNVAMSVCQDGKTAKRVATGTVKRLVNDADGRKSPGNVIVGSKRAWNAVWNAARAAHVRKVHSTRIANGVSGTRGQKAVNNSVLAVLASARRHGLA